MNMNATRAISRPHKSVNHQVVFITGAAGGIGAEVARRLHQKGAKLVLVDLAEAPLAALAAELGDDRVLTVTADVRDLVAMEGAVDKAVAHFGGLDIVMASAGIASYGSVLQVDPEAFKRVMDVNVVGVFHTVRATLPALIQRGGHVLIVSSMAAFGAYPGMAPYATSKAGVEQFANTLRLEVGHLGVSVASAHMSWIDTALVRDTEADLPVFRENRANQPRSPFLKITSVDKCATAFVKGIEGRKRRVYCPHWVGLFRWLKPVLSTPAGESGVRKSTLRLLSRMDDEVATLGRSTSARTEALEKQAGSDSEYIKTTTP